MGEPKPVKIDIPPPDPKKPYVLSENDRRFLRSGGIKQDQPEPAILPDEDDAA